MYSEVSTRSNHKFKTNNHVWFLLINQNYHVGDFRVKCPMFWSRKCFTIIDENEFVAIDSLSNSDNTFSLLIFSGRKNIKETNNIIKSEIRYVEWRHHCEFPISQIYSQNLSWPRITKYYKTIDQYLCSTNHADKLWHRKKNRIRNKTSSCQNKSWFDPKNSRSKWKRWCSKLMAQQKSCEKKKCVLRTYIAVSVR